MARRKFCRVPTHLRKIPGRKRRVKVRGYIKRCFQEVKDGGNL